MFWGCFFFGGGNFYVLSLVAILQDSSLPKVLLLENALTFALMPLRSIFR